MKRALPILPPNDRRCGPCTACCTAVAVTEIGKGEFERCARLRPRLGCSTYATRPAPCRSWSCMWLQGSGPASARPDKIGIVFDVEKSESLDAYVIKAFEIRKGAASTPRGFEMVKALTEAVPHAVAVAFSPGRRRVLGGDTRTVERFQALLAAKESA